MPLPSKSIKSHGACYADGGVINMSDYRSHGDELMRRTRAPAVSPDGAAALRSYAPEMTGVAERLAPAAASSGVGGLLGGLARGAVGALGSIGGQLATYSGSLNSGEDAELARLRSQAPQGFADGGILGGLSEQITIRPYRGPIGENYGTTAEERTFRDSDKLQQRYLADEQREALKGQVAEAQARDKSFKAEAEDFALNGNNDVHRWVATREYANGGILGGGHPYGKRGAPALPKMPMPQFADGGILGDGSDENDQLRLGLAEMSQGRSNAGNPIAQGYVTDTGPLATAAQKLPAIAQQAFQGNGATGSWAADPEREAGLKQVASAPAIAAPAIAKRVQRPTVAPTDGLTGRLDAQSRAIDEEARADLGPGGHIMENGTPYIDLAKGGADPEWRKRYDDRMTRQGAISEQRPEANQMPVVIKDGNSYIGNAYAGPADSYWAGEAKGWNSGAGGGLGRQALEKNLGDMASITDAARQIAKTGYTPEQQVQLTMNDRTARAHENAAKTTADATLAKAASKPAMPPTALKMQQESLDAIGTAGGMNADITAIQKQIDEGKLKFGPVGNLANRALNATGYSTEESRNFASFKATMEKLRNDSLRLNKGVQTEGDAVRAWNELFENMSDGKVLGQRLSELNSLNNRASQLHKLNIDLVRGNYGLGPLETENYTNQPAALNGGDKGAGAPKGPTRAEARPSAGAVIDGHKYKGGDPKDPKSWERVQ